jgi:sugar phosphate isomerase/epimerase
MSRLGIELLTVLGLPPVEHVKLSADLGCTHISTGLSSLPMRHLGVPDWTMFPEWSLENDPALVGEMKAAMRDTGIRIALGEGFRVRSDGDVSDRAAALDLMADIGAERINAGSAESDLSRTHDQLALLAEMVIARGMMFTIEFAPPTAINSLIRAVSAIEHVGRGKCRLLIDAMHFFRSGATVADLSALDPDLIGYAQLCDAPMVSAGGSYMDEAMFGRLTPGAGEFPLSAFVAALPAHIDIGLEVPNLALSLTEGSPSGIAARAVFAAQKLLAQSDK